MTRKALFIVLFTMISCAGFAQEPGVLYGIVRDLSGNTIPGASVYIESKPTINTLTDAEGKYELDLPAERDWEIIFSTLGGQAQRKLVRLAPGERKEMNIRLSNVETIRQVNISASDERRKPINKLDPRIVVNIPTPSQGIEGILAVAPVNFSNELSSSYSVRGGNFDENLVYVNDIQVYRPFLVRAGQQEGLSFPNPDMVDNIEFSAGGFEAKYGDRMSSVLDIRYRRPTEFGGRVSGGFLGGSIQLEDIGKKKRFTHNTGIRYKSNAYLLGSLDTQGDYNPNYTDVQTFITFKPEEYSPLEIQFLGNYSRNRYNFIPSTRETDIGNINEALRLTIFFDGQEVSQFETWFGALSTNYLVNEKVLLRFIGSGFQTDETETFDILGAYSLDELERDLGSDQFGEVLRNRGVGGFLEHARNSLNARVYNFTHKGFAELEQSGHYLEWGARYQYEDILDKLSEWTYIDSAGYASPRPNDIPGVAGNGNGQTIALHDVIKNQNHVISSRITGFVQDSKEWEFENGDKVTANLGVRGNYWTFSDQFVWGPRANLSYKPFQERTRHIKKTGQDTTFVRDVVFTLAGGVYWQPAFYREMRDLQGGVNPDIKAQRAIHVVGGMDYIFLAFGRPFKLITEVYYKDMDYLIPYEVDNVKLRYYATNNAKGYAYGADVMLNGEFINGVQSWMRLSYLKTEEDILDDFYYEYVNSDGEVIIPGYTLNDTPVDSSITYPGYIPRPTDQRVSFSLLFQDEMPRWPEFKVLLSLYYGAPLPFGPPSFERYLDTERTPAYRRVDIGFSRELFTNREKKTTKLNTFFKSGRIQLEVFNLLGINNTINYTWIEDVNGRQYAIPNFLTGRRINLKLSLQF
ncbi:MAG: carboxypeptidase regulatory-like domain-containing protein [Flavobacteriales bacterium]|nr:carboxypeptidase regulatory-like domain-containing protein [Flavobacteriales bacterium]